MKNYEYLFLLKKKKIQHIAKLKYSDLRKNCFENIPSFTNRECRFETWKYQNRAMRVKLTFILWRFYGALLQKLILKSAPKVKNSENHCLKLNCH